MLSRRFVSFSTAAASTAFRYHGAAPPAAGGKRYDLFGYEVDTHTAPWIEKIKKVQYYDQAGDILVEMNVKNCPPDVATYNATLQKIFECKQKDPEVGPNESKFCAMMDLIEEMSHRNKVHPNSESWLWVMKELVASKNYRIAYIIEKVLADLGSPAPADLVQANEANANAAKSAGNEHPSRLSKQTTLFETVEAQNQN